MLKKLKIVQAEMKLACIGKNDDSDFLGLQWPTMTFFFLTRHALVILKEYDLEDRALDDRVITVSIFLKLALVMDLER